MTLKDEIIKLKNEVKQNIEDALKRNQTDKVISGAKDLDILNRLENQYNEIEIAVNSFARKENFSMVHQQNINSSKQDSRQIGEEERQIFIDEAKKINIELLREQGRREVLYRNKLGGLIGIAYAYECTRDRWWLGLPVKMYHSMVLICKDEHLKTVYFIFPKSFCEKYNNKLGTDYKKAQFKFNISMNRGLYYLTIPNVEPIIINDYLNKFEYILN